MKKSELLKQRLVKSLYREILARKSEEIAQNDNAISASEDFDPMAGMSLEEQESALVGKTLYRNRVASKTMRKRSTKTFNMRWVIDALDQVVEELSEQASREPELDAAVQSVLAAKRLVHAYSTRLLEEPNDSDGDELEEAYEQDSIQSEPFSVNDDNASIQSDYVKGLFRRR